ncbi:nuclease-related domain-containing protein, partial [Prevotella histicola]|uniref:nuclease-related domain-containing protein n=1 Tax=Prevotella histicola TaxID=470565 RepID=UPI0028DBD2D8
MIIVTLIPLLIFFAILYLRFNKGKIAEKMVYHKLMQLPEEYHVIDDVLFMSNGRSTQIDHIVVSPYAVFVIETKGYKGWILGGENSEYWTQIIYKRKSTFYNPIHQNDGHIRFLKFLLKDLGNIPFVPIVVFNNEAELKVNVNTHIVVNRCCLKDAILQYKTPAISQEIKEKIISIIESNSKTLEKGATCEHKYNALRKQYDSQNK